MEGGTILIGAGASWPAGGQAASVGRAIAALGLLDTLLVLALGLVVASLAVPRGIVGRVQAPVSLFVAIGVLTVAIATATATKAIGAITIMVGLLLAVPFGTIVYLLVWAGFPVGKAAARLGLIMGLKLTGAVLLAVAHRGFLANKGLVVAAVAGLWSIFLIVGSLVAMPALLRSLRPV